MMLQSLEKKTAEIIDLKTKLMTTSQEVAILKRLQAEGLGAAVSKNDQEINTLELSTMAASQHLRAFSDLQAKYLKI